MQIAEVAVRCLFSHLLLDHCAFHPAIRDSLTNKVQGTIKDEIGQLPFISIMRACFLLLLWRHGAAVESNPAKRHRDDSSVNSKSAQQHNLHYRHKIGAPVVGEKGGVYRSVHQKDPGPRKTSFRKTPNTPSGRNLNLVDIQPRIVGGDVSEQGEFPYFVDMIWCGGVLIAPEVVLSAAHCESYVGLDVHVSGYQWASTGNGNGAVLARVVDEEMHPQFDGRTLDNDFFLHRLDSKVDLQTDITLRLNEDDGVPANGQGLSVMGLGLTEEGGRRPQRLNDVDVQYIPTKDCNKDLNGEVSDNMFCAGVDGGGKDSCNGDSGAPIVIREGDVHTVVGLVSWGYGCAQPDSPGVYARISSAMGWIREVVCDEWEIEADLCANPTIQPSPSPTESPTTGHTVEPTAANSTQPFSLTTAPSPIIDSDNSAPSMLDDPLRDEDEFSNSTDCVEVQVQLRTDRWPSENTLTVTQVDLLTEREAGPGPSPTMNMLNVTDLEASSEYMWDLCIDWDSNRTCTILNFTDSVGDGLADTGGLLVTWDGEVVYDEWDVGSGTFLEFGDGCLGY